MWNALLAAALWPILDWLAVGRVAAYLPNFEYRYWPLSRLRAASVILMDVVVFALVYLGQDYPVWYLLPFGGALLFWGVVMMSDVYKQRRSYAPPPFSDRYGG